MSFASLFRQFQAMKHYFIAAALIFITGFYIGYASPDTFQFIFDAQQAKMRDIVQSVKGSGHEQLSMFGVILKTNLLACLVTILFGAFFMVFPIYFLLTNGAMMGRLAAVYADNGRMLDFVKGIVPHGIIEIPAVIIAAAFGIRFGVLTAKGLISMPYPSARAAAGKHLMTFFKSLIPLGILLLALLVLAAVLESTVTYGLVGK